MFDIPIGLFIFKRPEKAALIIDKLSIIKPSKLYLIGDGPRSFSEKEEVLKCRHIVESHISWPCEVIKDYSDTNRGVYENIAGGARRVFHKEEVAIFLEDDNMPAVSFFRFCQEMLDIYSDDEKILWIMGSNYLKKYNFDDGASYAFTQNMLPCGWASWSKKFLKYYDGEFKHWLDGSAKPIIKSLPYSNKLKKQEMTSWNFELYRKAKYGRFGSWDYQMSFSLRSQNLLGIIPKFNQITNIGVDEQSIHGGTTYSNVMTERFCGNEATELEFPLVHPKQIKINQKFEEQLAKIIIYPFKYRLRNKIIKLIKRVLRMNEFDSLRKINR